MAAHQGQIIGLPLSSLVARILGWSHPTKNRAHSLKTLHAAVTVHDLGLIHPTKIDAAVAIPLDEKFDV